MTDTYPTDYDDGPPPDFDGPGPRRGRVPPHDLDAEESLLGAMLLSRSAIDIASELVTADAFYKPAHGHIYEAITSLAARGEPVDPVTVADELRRHDLLEIAGGAGTLIRLQAATPASAGDVSEGAYQP